MRYPSDHKQKTRARVVAAAGAVFRRDGYHAAGVDAVMKEAGLTAGGFYAHFRNKEALFAEAMRHGVQTVFPQHDKWMSGAVGPERIRRLFHGYLSLRHARALAHGCPFASLMPEVARAGPGVKEQTHQALEAWVDRLLTDLQPPRKGDRQFARTLIALAIGGLELARAMPDERQAQRVMQGCREGIDELLNRRFGEAGA